jgi:hypothetical protein
MSDVLKPNDDDFVEVRPLDAGSIAVAVLELWTEMRSVNIQVGKLAALIQSGHPDRKAAGEIVDFQLEHDAKILAKMKAVFDKLELPWPM